MTQTLETNLPRKYSQVQSSNLLFYGLLIYTVIFYSQLGSRFPTLAPFRPEFTIGTLLLIAIFFKIFNNELDIRQNGINGAAIFFLVSALITIPFAFVKSRALFSFLSLLKFCSIYLMIISAIDSENKLKTFMYVYLASISLLFVQPFLLSLQGKGFIQAAGVMRLQGITGYFAHPNQLGGITAANLPYFYYFMRYEKSRAAKVIFFLLIIVGLRVIMLTQSRTAFVGVFSFAFLVWLFGKRKLLGLAIGLVSCIVLWHVAPEQTKYRFRSLASTTYVLSVDRSELTEEELQQVSSMASRWTLIKRGLIAFSENPFLGLGLNCFPSFNGQRWGLWFPPHNTYVQALAEMGLVGFTAFCFFIFTIFRNLKVAGRLVERTGVPDNFLRSMISAVIVYLLTRLAVSLFGQDLYGNYWWVAAGLSVVILRIIKMDSQNQSDKNMKSAEVIALCPLSS